MEDGGSSMLTSGNPPALVALGLGLPPPRGALQAGGKQVLPQRGAPEQGFEKQGLELGNLEETVVGVFWANPSASSPGGRLSSCFL